MLLKVCCVVDFPLLYKPLQQRINVQVPQSIAPVQPGEGKLEKSASQFARCHSATSMPHHRSQLMALVQSENCLWKNWPHGSYASRTLISMDLMDHFRQLISSGCMPLACEPQNCTQVLFAFFGNDSQRQGMQRSPCDPLCIKVLGSNGKAIETPVTAEDFVCHILDCDNGTSVRRLSNQLSGILGKGLVS